MIYFFSPAEIQFHSALTSVIVQIPTLLFFSDPESWTLSNWSFHMLACYIMNGFFFHFQTLSAYALMEAISPITHR